MTTTASPIGYSGGKSKAIPTLRSIFEHHFPHATLLISPFIGGGSFELSMNKDKHIPVHANDTDHRLINFWQQFQQNPIKFTNRVKALPRITKSMFDKARERILSERGAGTKLDRALDYYILNRTSFASLGLSGGYCASMAERMVRRDFTPLSKFDLSNVTFHHGDWKHFLTIELKNRPKGAVVFLDPPYYFERVTRMYGKNGDLCLEFDHKRLYDYLKTKRGWMMSYNNVPYIKNLYENIPGVVIYECRWSYSMCESSKAKNSGTRWPELVIVRPFESSQKVPAPKPKEVVPVRRRQRPH